MALELHTASVRLPRDLYQDAARVAERRNLSFNALVRVALQKVLQEEEDREMFEAATSLGTDPETCDVGFALEAQAEVVLRDE